MTPTTTYARDFNALVSQQMAAPTRRKLTPENYLDEYDDICDVLDELNGKLEGDDE